MKYIFILSLIFSFAYVSNAQIGGNNKSQRIVKGKVLNSKDGSPLKAEIIIKSPDGKKFSVKSNSNGEFEQLLNSNIEYQLQVVRDDIFKEYQTIKVEAPGEDFAPQIVNINAKVLEPGLLLIEWNPWEGNSADESAGLKAKIKELKTFARLNRSIHLILKVSGDKRYNTVSNIISNDKRLSRKIKVEKTDSSTQIQVVVDYLKNDLK